MLPPALERRSGETAEECGGRIWARIHACLSQNDLPNAVALWDHYVPHLFRKVVGRDGGCRHNFALPSVVSSFMPKAGGTFLHNRLVHDIGYGDFWWGITDPRSASLVHASPNALRAFLLGGFTCHTHFIPSPQNVGPLLAIVQEPVWVHIRNPCDCVVAGYHHYLGQAQGEGKAFDARMEGIKQQIEQMRLDLSDIDKFALDHVYFYIDWLKNWVHYDLRYKNRVHFTFFDEMASPMALIQRVLARYGYEIKDINLTEHMSQDRRRSKTDDRRHIRKETKARITDIVRKELQDFAYLDRLLA